MKSKYVQDPGELLELMQHILDISTDPFISIDPFIIHSSSLLVALSFLHFHWAKQNYTHTLLNH